MSLACSFLYLIAIKWCVGVIFWLRQGMVRKQHAHPAGTKKPWFYWTLMQEIAEMTTHNNTRVYCIFSAGITWIGG